MTERQDAILAFIREFARDHGYPPSQREIGRAVGVSSTSVINYNLTRLEQQGYIQCDPGVARGIRILAREGEV